MPDSSDQPEDRLRSVMHDVESESERLEVEARRRAVVEAQLRLDQAENATAKEEESPSRPTVTVLCGSTRYPEAHMLAAMHLTMMGRIVIPCGLYGHADYPTGARHLTRDGDENTAGKQRLDTLHYRKIDISDGIFVVNVGGYIGSSTKREINYALQNGKSVEYMFDIAELF